MTTEEKILLNYETRNLPTSICARYTLIPGQMETSHELPFLVLTTNNINLGYILNSQQMRFHPLILRLKHDHLNLLKEESRKTYPVEACAMLFGDLTNEETVVRKVVVAPNRLHSTERCEIDPQIVVDAVTEAEEEGLNFVGLFHSHPARAMPSTIDSKFMRLWGDVIWLILSTIDGNLAAYQMKANGLGKITIIVE